jgi:hypothetical protein
LGRRSGSRARVGSPYGLRIVAPRSGFLTLLFLSQSRKWTLGYPGWRPPGVRLQGGRIYRFPQDLQPFPTEYPDVELIEFGEPGVETVVALCSSEPLVGPAPGNPSADTLPLLQEKYVTGLLQAALEMAESAFSYCAVKVAP